MSRFLPILLYGFCISPYGYGALHGRAEVLYTKAVVAFHDRDYDQALELLRKVSSLAPEDRDALAMMALTHKRKGEVIPAIQIYSRLVRPPAREDKNTAAYKFELGMLYFQEKDYIRATPCLKWAGRHGFNTAAVHYYLGQIALKREQLLRARLHFEVVLKLDTNDLKPGAHIHLAQLYAKEKAPKKTVRNLLAARDISSIRASNEKLPTAVQSLNRSTLESVEKWLAPFNNAPRTAYVTLESAYDSNVFLSPGGTSTALIGSSGKTSAKTTVTAGFTVGNSAIAPWQWLLSYTGSANYNFSNNTRNGQFISNGLQFYLTRGSFNRFRYGWNLSANSSLRYDRSPTLQSDRFRNYLFGAGTGPYASYDLKNQWVLGGKLLYSPQKFFLDSEGTTANRKSGWEASANFYTRREAPSMFLNPSLGFTFTHRQTSGINFQGQDFTLSATNTMFPMKKVVSNFTSSITYSNFPNRAVKSRADTNLSFSLVTQYLLDPQFTAQLNVSYIKNLSNIPTTYGFDRYALGLAGTVRF